MKRKKALKVAAEKLPKKRFNHCERVADTAVKMAEIFNADTEKCFVAGILHDYSKYDELSKMYQTVTAENLDPELLQYKTEVLHGPIAAAKMKNKFDITDEDILNAIAHHTSGRKQMGIIEKIIFVADYIEPKRTQPGVEGVRDIVFKEKNLDLAIYTITKANVKHLLNKDQTIYYKTIECLNYYNMARELQDAK